MLALAITLAAIAVRPANLECEFMIEPLGIDVPHPRLSWSIGTGQASYRVRVASSPSQLAHPDLWDSGRVRSGDNFGVAYQGKGLEAGERAFWSVRIWDRSGRASDWSKPASWVEGIAPSAWRAKWIGAPEQVTSPTVLLRRNFRLAKRPARAVCFICGLGQYLLSLNGHKLESDWLMPSWTQYQKTCVYDTHDVTRFLKPGPNSIGVHLGNGMYNMAGDTRGSQQPNAIGAKKLICQIKIWNDDGSSELVLTNKNWDAHSGPETYSGVFGGEDWDNRLYDASWDVAGDQGADWLPAIEVAPPSGQLRGVTRAAPALRTYTVQDPVSDHYLGQDTAVLDLGQNAPYIPEITVSGKEGDSISMWPAEALYADGDIDQRTMRPGKKCVYTLKGGGEETWHPLFWYCGSRYWKIQTKDANGIPIPTNSILKTFNGLLVHASEPEAGDFRCSNETLNRIYNMVHWSICGNFSHVVSDCPHREKSGWLEQLNMMGPDLMYCYDMRKMFDKAIHDMADAQHSDGRVPTMAPEYFFYQDGYSDSVEWGGSFLLVADFMKTWYDDDEPIRTQYPRMVRYLEYLETRAKDNILSYGLGDWVGYGADPRTPPALTGTAYYYKLASKLSEFAAYLGHHADAVRFAALASRIRKSFSAHFYDPKTGKYAQGSQSGQATALDFGLVDSSRRQKVFARLLDDIRAHNFGISLGEAGHGPLLRTLDAFSHSDWVTKIHLQSKLPGYVYLLNKGLTTMAETWDGGPISWNHFMLGQIVEWYCGSLLGIQPDPAAPGFKHFFIEPHPVPEVSWASGHYDSVRGRIEVSWHRVGKGLMLDVQVPPNSTATMKVFGRSLNLGPGEHHLDWP